MGLFRPYERTDRNDRTHTSTVATDKSATRGTPAPKAEAVVDEAPTPAPTKAPRGRKEGPTPTRREAEAARMERLHPTRSPREQRKAAREAKYRAQQEDWDRIERGPERTLLRDFVDARWTVAEFLMPAMILIMALMMVFMGDPVLSFYISLGLWVIFIIAAINIWIMWRSFKRELAERVRNANTRGLLMYLINRAMMIRRFRRPAPRIARGDSY